MKSVLITGGARGIGAASVRLFAREGWKTAFVYQKSDEAAENLSRETGALAIRADVSEPNEAARAVERAILLLGHLDAIVNNAGIAQFSLFTDLTNADWRRMMGVNLDGAFYVLRAALPHMITRKSGAAVNVSSMWGISGASCESHYAASKAALIGLTKSLAKELGPSGIRVNCVAPGLIDTDMNGSLTPDDLRALSEDTPLARIGKPEEVAEAILFLCSERSSFITGQVLTVDGGYL